MCVVEIATQLGTTTQTALSQLTTAFPTNWTSAHRGRGWSQLLTVMTSSGNSEAFESGIPQNLRAVVKGHKVYDPRLDDTQTSIPGSGSHRADDESTWEWSDNPALCLADFLMWDEVGYSESDDRIDWDLVAAAADICEQTPAVPTASTQARYTCNFTFFADQPREQVKEQLETAMLGRCIFSQGKWRMWAGAALAATVNLSEANLRGRIAVQASASAKERYNRVIGQFVDPDRDYTANTYPAQASSSFATEDGRELTRSFDFNACNDFFEAQRNAIIKLRQSRNQRVVVFEGNWSCFAVQPGTTVTLDNDELGFSGDKYFVTQWMLAPDMSGVDLVMVAESDSDWTDPLEGDYTTRTPSGDLVPPSPVAQLTPATISNTREDAAVTAGVRIGADGLVYYTNASGAYTRAGVPEDDWQLQAGNYWIRCTVNSGALTFGTTGAWTEITTDSASADFEVEQSAAGTGSANITLEIATDSAGSNVVASAVFVLSAEYTEAATLVINGGEFSDSAAGGGATARVSVIFEPDGELWVGDRIGGQDVQQDGEWWVDEPGTPPSNLEVRCSSITQGSFTAEAASVGVWVGLTSQREWRAQRAGFLDGVGTTTVIATFEIQDSTDPGNILATGTFTLNCTIT